LTGNAEPSVKSGFCFIVFLLSELTEKNIKEPAGKPVGEDSKNPSTSAYPNQGKSRIGNDARGKFNVEKGVTP